MNGKIALTESSRDAATWFRGFERRVHRRHDLLSREVMVETVGAKSPDTAAKPASRKTGLKLSTQPQSGTADTGNIALGHLVDLSARGIRVRVEEDAAAGLKLGSQLKVRVELPTFAGISAFIDRSGPQIRPARQWSGTMTVVRISKAGDAYEIGGRLEDIDELDQGMLSLYLSTQPLAA